MKLLSTSRYRRLVFAGMLVTVLSFGTLSQIFTGTVRAQTAVPTPPVTASKPMVTPIPDAAHARDMDKDTSKPIVTTPSGLKYVDVVVGKGPEVKTGDHLSVNYEGKLLDGTKFDSSYDRGQPFDLVLGVSQVIQGWTEGLAGMKVGGQRKLIIPPQLGYGMQGAGDAIPPNATLIFKVEVMAIKPN